MNAHPAPIDTSTLGPVCEASSNFLTGFRLIEMVKTIREGETIAFTRLANGQMRVSKSLNRDQIDEAPALT